VVPAADMLRSPGAGFEPFAQKTSHQDVSLAGAKRVRMLKKLFDQGPLISNAHHRGGR